jgi:hypothetical protein
LDPWRDVDQDPGIDYTCAEFRMAEVKGCGAGHKARKEAGLDSERDGKTDWMDLAERRNTD